MISIDRHIRYLLTRHDCVIVPGIGAFICNYHPARREGVRFFPPERVVGFNPEVSHNDGLLASSIARSEKISFNAATSAISESVAAIKSELESAGTFEIRGVGALTKTADGLLEFLPSDTQISSLSFRGLPELDAPTLKQLEGDKEPEIAETEESKVVYIPVSRPLFRIAASIAVLLLIGFVCSTPRMVDETTVNLASLSAPGLHHTAVEVTPATFHFAEEVDPRRELLIAYPTEKGFGVGVADTTKTVAKQAPAKWADLDCRISDSEEYCVVVASLNSLARARNFIAANGNPSLQILEMDGRFRVFVATSATEDSAKALAWSAAMQKRYPGAWVTKR